VEVVLLSKTTNYQLNLWDYGDEDFSAKRAREDLAENFTKLDEALKNGLVDLKTLLTALETKVDTKSEMIIGTYVGIRETSSTVSRQMDLGFRPKAILWGYIESLSFSVLAIDKTFPNTRWITINDQGFILTHGPNMTDRKGESYIYLAFR